MSNETIYGTSPIKRKRRTSNQLDGLLKSVQDILEGESERITIRHLFYRLVGIGVIEKTEQAYRNLCGHLARWRRLKQVAFGAFVDSTRWHIGGDSFDNLQQALENTRDCYRRNLWLEQSAYVEVWTEKDAISGILSDVADSFGVKVFTCRGFASLTSLYSAAGTFRAVTKRGKKVFIYYFGDHDPSGIAIDKAAVDTLRKDFSVEVELIRAAILPQHIQQYNLLTRPVKNTDKRASGWEGGCVEIDSMPPKILKQLVEDCITGHIDKHQWDYQKRIEAMEKETLGHLVGRVAA